ncbi:FtsX-like permease family protein [Oxalicibacterium faecigallinarum]|uniref:Peptide ABC transporter permease n=1 Tax=Oxalicibacterium faecigallinarum TaxID=573741 RepID=A0A8J3F3Q2_9BURK|nr:FtsX-like permease family protein [Oxalicibacterium faecigallinarum]GGI19840.1 peptide ABC transporter permease [Oxalicibacterium faecigallinarum]
MQLNAFSLALKSLWHRPLATVLNLFLMAIGIAMMTFILSASSQLTDRALRDAEGIDLVVGAKGSPLQLILSSIYQIDAPTGNIPLATETQLKQNRMVKTAIPLALGDSYRGFRIVGTNDDYIRHYKGQLAQGNLPTHSMHAVMGALVAQRTKAAIGNHFFGSHGLADGGYAHEEAAFEVVGILQPTGTVLDRLIITPVESVWKVHEKIDGLNPDDPEEREVMEQHRELTALLVQYSSPLAAVTMPRFINSQPQLQAAQPAFESAKLFRLMGVGIDVLRGIAAIVLLAATLAMFVALYHALEERRTDLAILRTLGASPAKLLRLLLTEGLLLALLGAALGWLLGHATVGLLAQMMASEHNIVLSAWFIAADEIWLLPLAIVIGIAAALIPAMRAYRTDIATTLAH